MNQPLLGFGGQSLVLPYEQDVTKSGFTQIASLSTSVDPATGELRVSDSETPARCVAAGMDDCASYAGVGLRLDQTETGGTNGHTVRVNHRWVNTTGTAKQLKVAYRVENVGGGWRFPGESSYTGHSPFETIPPTAGPASFFLALTAGSSCPGLSDGCGSVTWYRSPDSIEFTDSEVDLTYTTTIPAHGSRVLAFDYSHGYPQASVDGYAAAARSGFNTSFTVGKAKRNRKRGTARLPVDIPGAGKVAVSGKGIKPASVPAGASASAVAHSSATTVLIRPKAKVRRKLNRRGRARVTVSVTYTRSGLDPVTKTVKLTLAEEPTLSAPLLVVDAPSVLFRAFYALPDSIKGPDGHPVNALLGAANLIVREVRSTGRGGWCSAPGRTPPPTGSSSSRPTTPSARRPSLPGSRRSGRTPASSSAPSAG